MRCPEITKEGYIPLDCLECPRIATCSANTKEIDLMELMINRYRIPGKSVHSPFVIVFDNRRRF